MQQSISRAPVHRSPSTHHDTPSAIQTSGTLTSVRTIPTTVSQPSPTAALYAPFASEDMVMQAAGFNFARLVAGKPLYPLIARSDKECEELETWRHSKIEQLTEVGNATLQWIKQLQEQLDKCNLTLDEFRLQYGAEDFDEIAKNIKQLQHTKDALSRIEILSNPARQKLARLRPGVDKLYLLGHGAPGMNKLSADMLGLSEITAEELASQLAAGGLDPWFDDLRVSTCFSADARLPESFEPGALMHAAQAEVGSNRLWKWLGYGASTVEPFAQSLCNALKRAGFKQAAVSGYHGAGRVFSSDHHYNCLPGTQEADVRASSVRQLFSATV